MKTKAIKENWDILIKFFPEGWIEKAFEKGAITRLRKFDSPETLMRVLLIHLADGKSLRTTAAYAKEASLCEINDTALLKRLKASGEWLRWIALELNQKIDMSEKFDTILWKNRIRLVDGTTISEPGSTGSDWRIHYAINLSTLGCDTFIVTDVHTGENLTHFPIMQGDLILGDRGYCKRSGISHVLNNGGDVVIRLHYTNLPLKTYNKTPFSLFEKVRQLKEGEVGDWNVYFINQENELIKGRLCALRKSEEAIEKSKKKLRQNESKKGITLRPETIELSEYVLIFTTVNRHKLKGNDVLTLYRGRWQIELVFKRLKSIVGLGHLPKFDPESCKAWLYGKLVVALLVEHIYREAEFFSPWGYPLKRWD